MGLISRNVVERALRRVVYSSLHPRFDILLAGTSPLVRLWDATRATVVEQKQKHASRPSRDSPRAWPIAGCMGSVKRHSTGNLSGALASHSAPIRHLIHMQNGACVPWVLEVSNSPRRNLWTNSISKVYTTLQAIRRLRITRLAFPLGY